MARKRSLVIVGNGMATCRFLDEFVARDAQEMYDITVVGDEPAGLADRRDRRVILAREADHPAGHGDARGQLPSPGPPFPA